MRRVLGAVAIGSSLLTGTVTSTGIAHADSPDPSSYFVHDGSHIVKTERISDRVESVTVYAAAMDREVPLWIMHAADTSAPRPTLYLLNGIGGGEDNTSWEKQTDLVDFFKDKNANVVMLMAGRGSWYTDWERDDPALGRNKWSTLLGRELPPLINDLLGTNGRQSVAAISSSGSTVFNLAMEYPGLFTGVVSYSGCMQSGDPVVQQFIKTATEIWQGGGNVENMWGPMGSADWIAHDPEINAEKLRGTQIYMTTGNGLPGYPNDTPENWRITSGQAAMFDQLAIGGPIEMATNFCTSRLAARLSQLNIPAQVDFRTTGTHSWGYWQDDMHKSWPWIAGTLGL